LRRPHLLRHATVLLAALILLGTACSRADEDTAGGASNPTIPPAESATPSPVENTGATGASGVSGSLGESGVTGASGASGAAGPAVDVTAVEYEFTFEQPVAPGDASFTLTNDGEEPHELQVLQLTDGKTIDDLRTLIENRVPNRPPAWVTPVTGTFAKPGETSKPATGSLESGQTYVFACFVPTKQGVPHAALGMLAEVTVA